MLYNVELQRLAVLLESAQCDAGLLALLVATVLICHCTDTLKLASGKSAGAFALLARPLPQVSDCSLLVTCRKNFPPFRFDALLSAPFNWLLAKFVFSSPKLQKTFIPLPPLASSSPGARRGAEHAHWADDVIFAEQRLSGNNPIQIRLLTPDDPRADILRQASGGGAVVLPSLEDDLQAGAAQSAP